jgi:hypothetical protein
MALFPNILRRGLLAGGAVAILGGAAVGIAVAQAQPATPTAGQGQTAYQKFVDALAKRLNITTTNLETAISGARADAGLPANGKGFPGAERGGHGGGFGIDLNAAATLMGITPQQLRTELPGKTLVQVAQAHGKTEAELKTALKDAAHKRIDAAVTAGKVTADQAATQKTQADQRIDQAVTQVLPQGGLGEGFGRGGLGGARADLSTAATAIGITPQQLQTELQGKSLLQVAQAHGKTEAQLTAALKDAAVKRIDAAVAAGTLTTDQANQMKASLDQRISQQVNQVKTQRTPGQKPGTTTPTTGTTGG